MKKLKMAGLIMAIMSLGLLLVSCGGGSGGSNTDTSGLESPGNLETLSNDAGMESQPHYQRLEILPTSYKKAGDTSEEPLRGSVTITYSRYTGQVSPQYGNYTIYKYESSFDLINISNNRQDKSSSCYLVTELNDGGYCLGICNPGDPNEIIWEDKPVLMDFKTFEVGANQTYNSFNETGTLTVEAKEYITINNIKYPAWKIHEVSTDEAFSTEEYRWINPQYGILKMQITMTSIEDGSVIFLDGILRECH